MSKTHPHSPWQTPEENSAHSFTEGYEPTEGEVRTYLLRRIGELGVEIGTLRQTIADLKHENAVLRQAKVRMRFTGKEPARIAFNPDTDW